MKVKEESAKVRNNVRRNLIKELDRLQRDIQATKRNIDKLDKALADIDAAMDKQIKKQDKKNSKKQEN